MSGACFVTYNAVTSALTAPMAGTATNTAVTAKTILQLQTSTPKIRIIEYGYDFLSTPPTPLQVELVETGTIGATVTAGYIARLNDVTGPASGCASVGFNASAEGSIVATRLLHQRIDYGPGFTMQFPQGREPEVNGGSYVRLRITPTVVLTTAVTVICRICWEE